MPGPTLLAVALGAVMLAAVNPYGVAVLPAYISMLVLGAEQPTRLRAVRRAAALTASTTVGFATVFGVFGPTVAPVAAGLQQYLPYIRVVFGLSLVAALGTRAAEAARDQTLSCAAGTPRARAAVSTRWRGSRVAMLSSTSLTSASPVCATPRC